MNRPWMPLYIGDYLADTAHLRAAESGAYLHLIMHYWRHDGLPNDDRQLCVIAKMTEAEWQSARPVISPMFQSGWKHKRIDTELAKAKQKVEAASAGGKQSATKRNAKRNASDTPSTPVSVIVEDTTKEEISEVRDSESRAARAKETTPNDAWPGDAFAQFWERYPHKVGKKAALRAFVVAKRSGVAFGPLMFALERYIQEKPPDRSWCNPSTWLNQGRWDDQPADSLVTGENGHGIDREKFSVGRATERNAATGFKFGPRPGTPAESGSEGVVRLLSERRSG